jgi:hypothetical protein
VQIREQREVVAEMVVLTRDGFLDLEQQLSPVPDLCGVVEHRGAGLGVLGVGHRGSDTRSGLDEHLMT